ncbi:SH3 domain-containing protein [Maritalea mobilis]|uniref:SH3 domain-containing protein n=1 Tax=Maritalea mobilis TaxID=483324 RepID=UPI001C98685F|nr:SH3 domain-containing protein [Maritalea mobilis]MBY6202814.1 SH3 domain-containing protein [Maritalea mobilis]
MKMTGFVGAALTAAMALAPGVGLAGDCTGYVTGIRPISSYNHAAGNGFLAVRTGPGTGNAQIGELYLGDEVSVWARSGSWYRVQCMSGRCLNPLWGQANPNGWVHGRYLSIGGVCP